MSTPQTIPHASNYRPIKWFGTSSFAASSTSGSFESLLRQGRVAEAAQESFAGHEIVSRQSDPAVSFLKNARKDLVMAYDSLGEADKAARFRAELADTLPSCIRPPVWFVDLL